MFGFAKGTDNAPEGLAVVGEEDPELQISDGRARIVGADGPEIVHVSAGDRIYTAAETKQILRRSGKRINGTIPAYAGGKVSGSGLRPGQSYSGGGYSSGGSNSSGSKNSSSINNTNVKSASSAFEDMYKYHQHLLDMDQESVDEYLKWLNQAYKEAYKKGEIELEDYYKYQREVYDNLKDLFKDYLSDTEHQIDMLSHYDGTETRIISLYQELRTAIEKEIAAARKAGLDDTDDYIQDLQKKWMDYFGEIADMQEEVSDSAKDAVEDLIDFRVDMLKQELEDERDALDEKLDYLKEFTNKQKELLQAQYDQDKYLEEQAEKRKSVDDIQAELNQLKYDDSAWAQKRKLELEEELSTAQKDLDDFEKENALDQTMDLLDDIYEQQEQLIQSEIDAIEKKLNDPAALYNQALEDIRNNSEELYQQMVEYNNKHGDGNPETVEEMWESAYIALKEYIDLFGEAYKDIALANATGYTSSDESWDTNPVSGTNPDNQGSSGSGSAQTPTEQKPSSPSLTKGSYVTVKSGAKWYGDSNGGGSWGYAKAGTIKYINASGSHPYNIDGAGWVRKKDIVGYATGTKHATAGLHRFDEKGSEYVFADQGGGKYRLFSSGEKVLDAKSADYLYDFATEKGGGVFEKLIASVFAGGDFVVKSIIGADYDSGRSVSRMMQNATNNTVNNIDMSGDIIVKGNADEKTVSQIRREKRSELTWILGELEKLCK